MMGKGKKVVVAAACLLVAVAVGCLFAVSQCEREASNVSTSESEVGTIVGKPRVVKVESASAPVKEASDEEAAEEDVVPTLEQEAAETSSNDFDDASPSAAAPVAPSAPHPDDDFTSEEPPKRWVVDYERVWVEDSPAWDEQIPITSHIEESVCNICGAIITGNEAQHGKAHMLAGEGSGHHTEYVETIIGYDTVHHDATGHWETVEDGGHWE